MELFALILITLACVMFTSVLDQLIPHLSLPLIQIAAGLIVALIYPSLGGVNIDSELFLVLFIKEWTQGIYGMYAVKKAGYNNGALLCGKITTFYLYTMMALLLLWKAIPMALAYVVIFVGIGLLVWSFVSYMLLFRKMLRETEING